MNMQPLRSHAFAPQPSATNREQGTPGAAVDSSPGVTLCPFCGDPTPQGARHCPRCLRVVPATDEPQQPAEARTPSRDRDTVGAVYRLEAATHCSHCSRDITTIRVLRALRTQVSFTSTLPRKGYVIVCPECSGVLSSALSGII